MIEEIVPLWWLSFVDPNSDKEDKGLGVCLVGPARTHMDAIQLAWKKGCNPGGEVMSIPFPEHVAVRVPAGFCDRLLTRAEAEGLDELLATNALPIASEKEN